MFVHPQIPLSKISKALAPFLSSRKEKEAQERLVGYFPGKQIVFTDMGRTGFKIIIEKLQLQGSQMLLPAYICDIFYPILKHYNITPIFLDIDLKTFQPGIDEIKRKITQEARAILVCHTYGLPGDMVEILAVARQYNLKVIEDCAHSFGAEYRDQFLGNFGDAAFFSIYKQFPTARGGFLVCPADWSVSLSPTRFGLRDFLSFLNSFSFFAFLFKSFGQGIAHKMLRGEKTPRPPGHKRTAAAVRLWPGGLNRVSLNLFVSFLSDFENNLARRRELALFFQSELQKLGFQTQAPTNNVFCYLSALVSKELQDQRDIIVKKLRQAGIFCTRVWHTPIILNPKIQQEYNLNPADFPNTFSAAKRLINSPLQNHYTERDIVKIVKGIKKVVDGLKTET